MYTDRGYQSDKLQQQIYSHLIPIPGLPVPELQNIQTLPTIQKLATEFNFLEENIII